MQRRASSLTRRRSCGMCFWFTAPASPASGRHASSDAAQPPPRAGSIPIRANGQRCGARRAAIRCTLAAVMLAPPSVGGRSLSRCQELPFGEQSGSPNRRQLLEGRPWRRSWSPQMPPAGFGALNMPPPSSWRVKMPSLETQRQLVRLENSTVPATGGSAPRTIGPLAPDILGWEHAAG